MKTMELEKLNVAATSSGSCLAIFHFACWTSSVITGSVAIWIRRQATTGISQSILGITGVGLWGSLPYLITGVLAVRAVKQRSFSAIKWFYVFSAASLVCSTTILIFSSIAIAIEASVEIIPKRLILAALLTGASTIEVTTSLISCFTCYRAIGCCNRKAIEPYPLKHTSGNIRGISRNGGADEMAGHVTVMALPPKQAAELFYTMYRPFFPNVNGMLNVLNDMTTTSAPGVANEFHESAVSPDNRRSRRHSRRHAKTDPRDLDMINGSRIESIRYTTYGDDYSDEDANLSKSPHRHKRHHDTQHDNYRWQQEELDLSTQIPNSGLYDQTRLTPLPEQDNRRAEGREDHQKEVPVANEESNDEEQQSAESPRNKLSTSTNPVKENTPIRKPSLI